MVKNDKNNKRNGTCKDCWNILWSFLIIAPLSIAVIVFALAMIIKSAIVYTESNEFGDVYVVKKGDKICIKTNLRTFGSHSCFKPTNPDILLFDYNNIFLEALEYFNITPNKVLLIGLGGGTFPKALAKKLPETEVDIVEINPAMVKISREFFDFKPNEKTKIYLQDGVEFIMNNNKTVYDFIFIDAYNDSDIPKSFLDEKFITQLSKILANHGMLAIHINKPDKFQDEINMYKKHFKYTYVMQSDKNYDYDRVLFLSNVNYLPK